MRGKAITVWAMWLLAALAAWGGTNQAPLVAASGLGAEEARNVCLAGAAAYLRRVTQITAEGLVVDSGYVSLLDPPFNQSWVVRGSASVTRNEALVEEKRPDAVAVGVVLLVSFPKRPEVKLYDYVVIRGYPAGEAVYAPVPGAEKKARRFSASLDRAVKITMLGR